MMGGMNAYISPAKTGKRASKPHTSSRDRVALGDYFSLSKIFND